jgi:hypothetical protein
VYDLHFLDIGDLEELVGVTPFRSNADDVAVFCQCSFLYGANTYDPTNLKPDN